MFVLKLIAIILIYPFVAFFESFKRVDDINIKREIELMQDSFYIMSFFLRWGEVIKSIGALVASFVAVFVTSGKLNLISSTLIGIAVFVVSFWVISVFIYMINGLSYLIEIIRNIVKRASSIFDSIEGKTKKDDDKEIVH